MAITVRQYGFSTGSGLLANLVDDDATTGWAPLTTGFDTYTAPFLVAGVPNVGHSFPAIEFDFGAPVRVSLFLLQVEGHNTLGPAILVASDNPATSVANTLQSGDVLLGEYTAEEITGNLILGTAALTDDIRKRYIRLLQRQEP